MGVHRANDFLMFGRKLTVQELESWGLINRVFPVEGFHNSVTEFLEKQLEVNDGVSMMETKRLQNLPLRSERILAVYNATDALSERLASGAPAARFRAKKVELDGMTTSGLDAVHWLIFSGSEIQVTALSLGN
jgi:peroxisomal 3,2-trans-enoyl-CoA isomerase